MRGKRHNGFLPQLRAECPVAPAPTTNEWLAELLRKELEPEVAECADAEDYFSLRDLLFPVARDALKSEINNERVGRAVDYMQGRIYWQLSLARARPPRAWREGPGVRMLGESVYERLDSEARRVLDFWARLKLAIAPEATQEQFVEGAKGRELLDGLEAIRLTSPVNWTSDKQGRLRRSLLAS